jgi:hypothetical protein
MPSLVGRFPAVYPVSQGPFPIAASAQWFPVNRPTIERLAVGMGASRDAPMTYIYEKILQQPRFSFSERVVNRRANP